MNLQTKDDLINRVAREGLSEKVAFGPDLSGNQSPTDSVPTVKQVFCFSCSVSAPQSNLNYLWFRLVRPR